MALIARPTRERAMGGKKAAAPLPRRPPIFHSLGEHLSVILGTGQGEVSRNVEQSVKHAIILSESRPTRK